jgi:rhamnosyltransferase
MRATVLIRAKNEAKDIGHTLELIRAQTEPCEIVLVDSGSTDATVEIARGYDANVIEIAPESFTYGRALNIGARAATTPIVVPLSAHAFPPDEGWLERMLAAMGGSKVACACGGLADPNGRPLTQPFVLDWDTAQRHPQWGYTNSAGAFRRDLHEQHPFREDMPFTEDKEWAWHWLQRGWTCVVAPDLTVDHDHSKDPIRETWTRARAEWIGFGMYLDLPPYRLTDAFRDFRASARGFRHPKNIAREAVRYAGVWSGRRAA